MTPAVPSGPLLSSLQIMLDVHTLLVAAGHDDASLLEMAPRYTNSSTFTVGDLRAVLSSRLGERLAALRDLSPQRGAWPTEWIAEGFNRCVAISMEGIYLLGVRSTGGTEAVDAVRLRQLVDELGVTLATCFPQQALSAGRLNSQQAVSLAMRPTSSDLRIKLPRQSLRASVSVGDARLAELADRFQLPRNGSVGNPTYRLFGVDLRGFLENMGIDPEDSEPIDLRSLRQQLLVPFESPVRDAQGFWVNPGLPLLDHDVDLAVFLESFGLESCWVAAEDQLDPDTFDRCVDAGCWLEWIPTIKSDGEWVLLTIHDTEVGAVAGFIRNFAADSSAEKCN